jgi:ketosteroid isomerase-like protein
LTNLRGRCPRAGSFGRSGKDRGYGSTFFFDRCHDLRVHRSDSASVVLEYASEGKVVATGYPYSNRYISVITVKDRKVSHWRDYLDPLRVFAALEGR